MVIMLLSQLPVTPVGNPEYVAPVAPIVFKTIGVIKVEICVLRFSPSVIVLFGVTVIVPVAFTTPQPPVNGIV